MIISIKGYTVILILFLIVFTPPVAFADIQSSSIQSTENTGVTVEPDSFFNIKIVSPEFLEQLRSHIGVGDEVLKIGPGIVIGIVTPEVLYIRGDFRDEAYLIENRNTSDLKTDISQHLVDIAFGKDSANLSILKKDLDYIFWFDASFTDDDINTALDFARLFNNLSRTARYEDEEVMLGDLKNNYESVPYHYYNVKLIPMRFLDDYKKDKFSSTTEQIVKDKTGKMIGILSAGYVYLWNGLSPEDRRYYLTKSLFWSSGLHGETSTRPESFFYKNANTHTTLSDLDKEAIELLYGGRLNNDMNADRVKTELDISH